MNLALTKSLVRSFAGLLVSLVVLNFVYSNLQSLNSNPPLKLLANEEERPDKVGLHQYALQLSDKSLMKRAYDCDPILENASNFKVAVNNETYPKRVPLYENVSLNLTCLNSSKTTKTILMWTKMFGPPFAPTKFGENLPFTDNMCPLTNCEITTNREKLNQSDLVVFHVRNQIDYIPERAHATQRFVFMVYESMVHCKPCSNFSDHIFNYSATPSTDSDYMSIYWTNSGLYWARNETFDEQYDFAAGKTRIAAARISNIWYVTSDRFKYIEWLKKSPGMSVDLYGAGGNLTCPGDCMQYIADKYMFFLAFENSLCSGYGTEKIFDWLNFNIIPVVLGFGNYSFYVPKSAYIDALDFKSPDELGEYLVYLSVNKTAYNEYFKWKKNIRSRWPNVVANGFFCEMCVQLQLEAATGQMKRKLLTNIKSRFSHTETCLKGRVKLVYELNNMTNNDLNSIMSPDYW
jgi:hypothetical protein